VVSDSRRWLGRGRVLQMRKAWPGHPTFPSRLNVRTFGRSSVGQAPLAMLLEQSINELNKNPHRRPRSFRTRSLPATGWKLVSIRDAHSFLSV